MRVEKTQKVLYIVTFCSKYTRALTFENTVQGVCITGEAVPEDPRFLLNGVGFNAIWLHQPVFDLIGTNKKIQKTARVRSHLYKLLTTKKYS